MRIAIGDKDGNLLGLGEAEGITWTINGDALVNTVSVSVQIHRGGMATLFSFIDSNENILSPNGRLDTTHQVGLRDTIMFLPGKMRIFFDVAAQSVRKLPPVLARLK